MMKAAERKLGITPSAEDTSEEESPEVVEKLELIEEADPPESDEDRLTREYIELDAQRVDEEAELDEMHRQLAMQVNLQTEVIRALKALEKELGDLDIRRQRLAVEKEIAQKREEAATRDCDTARQNIDRQKDKIATTISNRDDRSTKIDLMAREREHERRLDEAARVIEGLTKGLTPEDLLAALARAGVCVNPVPVTEPAQAVSVPT